jgi:hypothetical protein
MLTKYVPGCQVQTARQTSDKHEYQVLQTLAHVGWSRPEEVATWTAWPGASAVAMARRTLEQLAREGLLLKKRIAGKGNGNAYMLAAAGTARCLELGLNVHGKGKDLQIGSRWHEHVLGMHVLNDFRQEGFEVYFARQLAWAPAPPGFSKSSGLRQLGPFRYAKPLKAPDAAVWRRNANGSATAITVEIEWSPKSGPKRRHQTRSILDQIRRTDTLVCIAYPYPPQQMGELLAARKPNRPAPRSLDHESNWRRALNAAGAEPHELNRIYFVRLLVDTRVELLSLERLRASTVQLEVTQHSGSLRERVIDDEATWQCLEQWDTERTLEGALWLHPATQFTLRLRIGFVPGAAAPGYLFVAGLRPWRSGTVEDHDVDELACSIYENMRLHRPARTEFRPMAGSLGRDIEADTRVAMCWFEQQIPTLQALTSEWVEEAIRQAVDRGL